MHMSTIAPFLGTCACNAVCNVRFWFTLTVDLVSAWNRHWYPTWCVLVANQGSRICPLPLRKQTREAIIMLDVDIPHRAWHPPFQLTHNRVCIYPVAGRRPHNAEKTDCHVANMRVQPIAADIQLRLLLRRHQAFFPCRWTHAWVLLHMKQQGAAHRHDDTTTHHRQCRLIWQMQWAVLADHKLCCCSCSWCCC